MAKKVMCPRCKGRGSIFAGGSIFTANKEVPCPVCGGSGKVNQN